MHTLMGYLKRYRRECIIAPLFKMLETVMELLVPIMMKRMIDEGIAGGNRQLVWQTGLWLAAFGLLGFAFACTAQYFSARAAVGTCRTLRSALFQKIEHLDPAASEQIGVSTLINRMTGDMNQVQTGINLTLRLALRSPFVVFGAMAMAFTVNARLAWVFAVIIPALTAVVLIIGNITMKGHTGVQRRQDQVLKHTRENLTGVRVLRAFNRQDAETADFQQENGRLLVQQEYVGKVQALLNPLTYVLVNLGLIVLLQNGGISVWQGTVSVGCVVALCDYLSQILVELIKLTNLVNNITKAVACANRIEQVMNIPAVRTFGTCAPDWDNSETVRFDHVTFTYPGAKHPALNDVGFVLHKGESIGIIGGTGSGKSTLAELLTRAYDPDSGTVSLGGVDVREQAAANMLRSIGMVPQQASLFSGTVAENLCLGLKNVTDEVLWQSLEAAQAADFIREKPLGLKEICEQGGRNFSGGQRQRLTIARALVHAPKLLILDDSTSALDYATEAALRSSLRHAAGDPSVIWISQRASTVRHADRILVLNDGEAVGFDTHEALLRTCDEYREIVRSQHPEEVEA